MLSDTSTDRIYEHAKFQAVLIIGVLKNSAKSDKLKNSSLFGQILKKSIFSMSRLDLKTEYLYHSAKS